MAKFMSDCEILTSKWLVRLYFSIYGVLRSLHWITSSLQKIPSSEHVENMLCTQIVFFFFCFTGFDIQNNLCTQHVLPMICKNKSFLQRFTCTCKCLIRYVVLINCFERRNKKKQFVYTSCSQHVLSLEFLDTELVI